MTPTITRFQTGDGEHWVQLGLSAGAVHVTGTYRIEEAREFLEELSSKVRDAGAASDILQIADTELSECIALFGKLTPSPYRLTESVILQKIENLRARIRAHAEART